jgi:hypothetical protein
MATVTDDAIQDRCLLDRPQRLGIFPTWWFWRDRDNWRWIRWPFAIFITALVIGLVLLELPLFVVLPVYLAVYVIALGSVERYIRHKALERRELAASTSNRELPRAGSLPDGE